MAVERLSQGVHARYELQLVARAVRSVIRADDMLFRWGGDEFLLLFPAALPAEVVPRVREAIQTAEGLEVSLGAARFSSTEELPTAIERADRAMYEEKMQKRAARTDLRHAAALTAADGSASEGS